MLVIVYYREAVVGTLRVIAAKTGHVVQARVSGKIKSLILAFAANTLVGFLVVSHYAESFRPLVIPVAQILSVVVSLGAVVSLVDYYLAINRIVGKK